MDNINKNKRLQDLETTINTAFAKIEFSPYGKIIHANNRFLQISNYDDLEELKGKNHSVFIDTIQKESQEYQLFWEALRAGESQEGTFKHLDKNGEEFWIQAVYTPVKDTEDKVHKVIQIARNITQEKCHHLELEILQETVDTSFERVEFTPNGHIIDINNNMVELLGFSSKDELIGQHHSILVSEMHKTSDEYQLFWEQLRSGHTQKGEFERIGKEGKQVWIQAAYTPVKNEDGKVIKIIKVASDISKQKESMEALLVQQRKALQDMSVPTSQLWDKVSFIPLVGFIDSVRANKIMQIVLNNIQDKHNKVFILDISGISVIDTAIANHLLQIVKASNLMGCLCIISGVSSSVAQTIVELGIDTSNLVTTSTMQDAIRKAFQIVGMNFKQKVFS